MIGETYRQAQVILSQGTQQHLGQPRIGMEAVLIAVMVVLQAKAL
jgi:hypothetical protein